MLDKMVKLCVDMIMVLEKNVELVIENEYLCEYMVEIENELLKKVVSMIMFLKLW